jgi:hypothetical protein
MKRAGVGSGMEGGVSHGGMLESGMPEGDILDGGMLEGGVPQGDILDGGMLEGGMTRDGMPEHPITEKSCHGGGYRMEGSLHRAWEGLHFDRRGLHTTDRQQLRILHPGTLNTDQGPDFLHAAIQIGKARLHGHVELHIVADDWKRHGHDRDPHYNNVMLHAFLVAGKEPAFRADGSRIPELCLGDRIGPAPSPKMQAGLACSGVGKSHLPLSPGAWLEDAGMERMMGKARHLQGSVASSHYDWQQVLWQEMAATLGGPVNASCFRQLAGQVPWSLVRKYVHSPECIEALLFGAGGLLAGNALDDYHGRLQAHWDFLRQKHGLKARPIPFKFHRMHPAGFPTLRIAQLGMMAAAFRPLCQLLEPDCIRRLWEERVGGHDYWATRHDFGNTLKPKHYGLGQDARERLIVNVLVPMALAGKQGLDLTPDNSDIQGLMDLLRSLPAEENKVTRKFAPLGLVPRNALQSQGMIGMYRDWCSAFRCMECIVGKRVRGIVD